MNDITLRPAEPHDKAAITALAAQIWEGEDYLAHLFDNWVAQQRGRFILAFDGEELAGCNKLTEIGPGEWWMEGLRVAPGWRGQGIARLLHENIVRLADEIIDAEIASGNISTAALRLATNGANLAVHKLALETGFHPVSRHLLYKKAISPPPDTPATPTPFTPANPDDLARITSWLDQSAHFAACGGLMEDNWKWYEIRPRLAQLLRDQRIYRWRKTLPNDTIATGLVIIHNRDDTLILNYLDTPTGHWMVLAEDIELLASAGSTQLLKCKPLAAPEISAAFPAAGWTTDYDLEMQVFERPFR